MPALIQSEARPSSAPTDSNIITAEAGDQALGLLGLVDTTGRPVPLWGAGYGEIDQNFPATGFGNARTMIGGRVSVPYTALLRYALESKNAGNIGRGVILHDGGFGGLAIGAYAPAGPAFFYENELYYLQEAKRLADGASVPLECPYLFMFIGTSGKAQDKATWYAEAAPVVAEYRAMVQNVLGVAPPKLVAVQTGGDVNTIADVYDVPEAQLDLVKGLGGLMATHQRIFLIWDANIHPRGRTIVLMGETIAWAIREDTAGRPWNIFETVALSGLTATVSFSLRAGETLVNRPDLYDDYGGPSTCINFGFESDVAITSVVPDLNGNTVSVTFASAPTWLSFAQQRQNVSTMLDVDGQTYSAHRTTLFPSETLMSTYYPGETLWRSLPGFTHFF